jgi:LCP family protein required for cell wall assembly
VNQANSLRVFVRRFVVASIAVSVISASVMVAANVLENRRLSRIPRISLPNDLLAPSKPGAPANYLIVGSDSRAFADTPAEEKAFGSAAQLGGARSDVMMIVHVVPALGTAFVVSFPRDTYVAIPDHGTNLLNAAFAFGGPALLIKTFSEDFGIPIQHYLSVNFPGFEKIVDSIGHVKIYFPTPARDFFSGLSQPVAGCASLNGVQALAYARSRHYAIPRQGVTNPNPDRRSDWSEDPRADLDRIKRQQYFLRSLGQTALEHGASNPVTALHLADAVASSLSGDKTLTNRDLKSLVRTFRGLDPATVEMTTLPVVQDSSGHLVAQYPEAQPVLDRLKNLSIVAKLPELVSPSNVKVVVVDGSGVPGRAASVQAALAARGFVSGGFGDATRTDYAKTQVRYQSDAVSKGFTTALYLGTSNVAEVSSTTVRLGSKKLTGDVIVVIGRDYPSLRGVLSRPIPTSTTTTSTTAPAGGTTSTTSGAPPSSTSSTTTAVTTPDTRYVPTARHGRRPLVGCP